MLYYFTSEFTLKLQNTAEKEHIIGDTTLQDLLVEKIRKNNRSINLVG